jgi:hypothetical protein
MEGCPMPAPNMPLTVYVVTASFRSQTWYYRLAMITSIKKTNKDINITLQLSKGNSNVSSWDSLLSRGVGRVGLDPLFQEKSL